MSTKFVRFVAALAILVSVAGNTGVALADRGAPPSLSAQNLEPSRAPEPQPLDIPPASSLGVQFDPVVTAANTAWDMTTIDHPLTNGNPNAARELHVCKTGGTDVTTIQDAVDAAQPGDVIKVAAATYNESSIISSTPYNLYITKTVSILGGYKCSDFTNRNPSVNVTTIHPFTTSQSVVFVQGQAQTNLVAPIIDGFTITGGGGGNHGGGITLRNSDATISNNVISGNFSYLLGGGIWVQNGAPLIQYNRIQNNTASAGGGTVLGGGIELENTQASVVSNIIANNTLSGSPAYGGGVDISGGGPVTLVNNTIANNDAQGVTTNATLTTFNSIIMNHTIGISTTAPAVTVNSTYNIYFGNDIVNFGFTLGGTDMPGVNPQLTADFHLNAGSPAIDAGTHTNAPNHDIDGEPRAMIGTSGLYKIDIGADEFSGTAQSMLDVDQGQADLTIIGPGGIVGQPDPNANNWMGYSVLGADVNGDGRADLIMAAQDWAEDFNTLNATGRLFGLNHFGARTLGTIDLYTRTADLTVVSKYLYQHVGQAFASGDVNGDGKRDLIVSSNNDDSTAIPWPTVFVLFGGSSLNGTRTIADATPANFMLLAPAKDYGAYGNHNAVAAGDVNDDGVDDLLVGDSLANDGATAATGAVFGIFGSPSLSGSFDISTTAPSLAVYGPAANAKLEKFALGRLNNDGQLDLVARTDTTAYVLFGPRSGVIHLSSTPADVMITGLASGGVAVLDFNGDGTNDLILGSASNIYVVPGPFTGGQSFNVTTRASLTLTGIAANTFAVGDVVGDPKPDLLIGADANSRAIVIPGGTTTTGSVGTEDLAPLIARSNSDAVRNLGFDVAAGDLDGDRKADLIIGSLFSGTGTHPENFNKSGKVFVIYGTGQPGPVQIFFAISGNTGVGVATLSYTDGTAKTVTADASGNYSLQVSNNWSGTVTPSKVGYSFSPVNRPYTNVLTDQTVQDYTATAITFTISGNAGVASATLSYTDGTLKSPTADGTGLYSFQVSYNWSGTVTPSKTGYSFSPASKTYANVLANQIAQNYTATPITFTISGNAGVGGATLSYFDGVPKTATSASDGSYSFTVSYNWSGKVTPSKTGCTFLPDHRDYTNVLADQTGQDYTVSCRLYLPIVIR